MTEHSQLHKDRNLLTRIDEFGKGLTSNEVQMLESFLRWVEGGTPLTEKQRRVAEEIDERCVR